MGSKHSLQSSIDNFYGTIDLLFRDRQRWAMRKQLRMPPTERTIFIDNPHLMHSSLTAIATVSAGVFFSRSSTSSIPTSKPFPRTSPMCSWRSWRPCKHASRYAPRCFACSTRCSASMTSITCAGYLGHLLQKRALTMAQPVLFLYNLCISR